MVIVIAWIHLEYRVNALALVEGMNLFCVLLDTLKNRVFGLALLISREKYIQSGRRFGSWEKMYSFIPGNQRDPDILPTRENKSVW